MTGHFALFAALTAAGVTEPCPTCGHVARSDPLLWLVIGFTGQAIFTARFLAQWIASEKKRDAVVPVIFWWLSMAGGMTLLSYAIHRQDPVIIVGQSMGVFIYIRNLMLVAKRKKREAKAAARAAASVAIAKAPGAPEQPNPVEVRVDTPEPGQPAWQARDVHVNGTGSAAKKA
jgi:lipid-A-disaccharide synthase-like uncharacterized protein